MAMLSDVKVGVTFQKGGYKRTIRAIDGVMVFYKTPSKPNKVVGESMPKFNKWLMGAVKVD
ncbi:hypothetical protein FT641_19115 [Bacillus paranthracis]|uniref:hypothetical protein n=1 Tax=Bacillus paranthracis TaxID=2026186 RepID=UPI001879458E|nr:hypothetical protein [Bacillus paranthracis]MBE7114323.1 hypothetical protein [Bacillus paranthracis]MBE7154804.1 hypothetical protein [Bacillus paranthracis]